MMRSRLTAALFALLLVPVAAAGQNREHLQMNADIRQLQENVSRLQLAVNRLTAQLEETNKRIEGNAASTVKGFADQQMVINQLSATIQTIRERLDDNNVRVSQLSQEFSSIREGLRLLTDQINTLVALLAPAAAAPADSNAAADPSGGAAPPAAPGAPLSPVVMPLSATRTYQAALSDYQRGRYDIAIEGFREVVEKFPDAPDAANAQFQIGESLYYKGDFKGAIVEYQKFIDTYPQAREDDRAAALFLLGSSYENLKQTTNARRMYERVIKEYPNSTSALQARQRLDAPGAR
jgi:tol-pal system protein YbgF